MGAKPNPKRKAALLGAFVAYVLKNGLSDLSLRPAAAALRTSPRMLLYHFGSKEDLIVAAIAEARTRELQLFARAAQKWGETSPVQAFRRIWGFYTAPSRRPYLRFFFEVYGLALQNPDKYPEFLRTVGSDFLGYTASALVANGISERHAAPLASLHIASIRGLLMDLMTTGDRARVDAAAQMVADSLDAELRLARARRDRRSGRATPRTAARGRRRRTRAVRSSL